MECTIGDGASRPLTARGNEDTIKARQGMVRAAPHRGLIGRSLQSDCSAAVHGSIAGGNEGTRGKKERKKKSGRIQDVDTGSDGRGATLPSAVS